MDIPSPTLKRVGTVVAYLVVGALGTAVVSLALLYTLQPVQRVVYDAFYLYLGPSEATEAAILTHFLLAGFSALGIVLLAGDYLSDRLTHRTAVAKACSVLLGVVVAFLLVAVLGLVAFLTALIALVTAVVAVPLLLRYRYGVESGGIPAFVGGIPVLVILLLLAGFGLGWGWGYTMAAEEVPQSAVNEAAVTNFGDVPQVREDLFASDCTTGTDGRQTCRLPLRGSEHELQATRFMARHGVRCPFQNAASWQSASMIATYNGSYYRITCSPHGD